jgi:hypothetical protein
MSHLVLPFVRVDNGVALDWFKGRLRRVSFALKRTFAMQLRAEEFAAEFGGSLVG